MSKAPISLLFEYCQSKNTSISISDLKFVYEQLNNGLYNCKVIIKDLVFDQHLECKSKKMAKNIISGFVYEELKKMDNEIKKPVEDKRNPVAKLNEYLQDKHTKINTTDVDFSYETDKDGLFNCKVKIKKKVFDKHSKCKTKREAKNIISEYVYNYLTGNIKPSIKFSEEVLNELKSKEIQEEDLDIEIQDIESDIYICLIEFKKYNKTFTVLEPKSFDAINNDLLKYLKNFSK